MGDVNMDALAASVAKVETVAGSAVTLIRGFIARIDAVKDDPAAISAELARIDAAMNGLAAAVAENTEPAPAPAPTPEPAPTPDPTV